MSKHTKEDWGVSRIRGGSRGDFTGDLCISAKGTPKIATVHIRDVSVNEAIANAKLVAAAPELLAACQLLISNLQGYEDGTAMACTLDTEAIEAAIAKATE